MTKLVVDQAGYQVEGRQIWHDISFELHDGDWVTVVGPSGGGKSTLLKAIAGLQDITEGHIFLNDEDVMRLPIGDYRQQVSYATQSAQLFGETVRDNL
ncbi:MAG: ATP-binding cassette domain-containing protein, partial [Weissella cibaria]